MAVVWRHALLLGLLALPACSSGSDAACGPVQQEPLDPSSAQHVVPGTEIPAYSTDPPTSGAHYSVEVPSGVQDRPLEEPLQVTVLEAGKVLIQYRPGDVSASDVEGLAGAEVVVAPNPSLPDPVMLTAWVTKQSCSGLDAAAVDRFVADQRGRGPGAGN